jgi:hypothetical protein
VNNATRRLSAVGAGGRAPSTPRKTAAHGWPLEPTSVQTGFARFFEIVERSRLVPKQVEEKLFVELFDLALGAGEEQFVRVRH